MLRILYLFLKFYLALKYYKLCANPIDKKECAAAHSFLSIDALFIQEIVMTSKLFGHSDTSSNLLHSYS